MTIVTGETLAELDVPVPGYDRRQVTTGIVHIGVGGSTVRTRPCTSTR